MPWAVNLLSFNWDKLHWFPWNTIFTLFVRASAGICCKSQTAFNLVKWGELCWHRQLTDLSLAVSGHQEIPRPAKHRHFLSPRMEKLLQIPPCCPPWQTTSHEGSTSHLQLCSSAGNCCCRGGTALCLQHHLPQVKVLSVSRTRTNSLAALQQRERSSKQGCSLPKSHGWCCRAQSST